MKSFILSMLMLVAVSASGQVVRTWVSTSGVDNAVCSRSSPCRNFAAAVAAVDPGGEVVVLDSGGYGAVTITQSVAIIAPAGVHAAIAPTTLDGITIDDPQAVVILKHLYLGGRGAVAGIYVTQAAALYVDETSVVGFTDTGIIFSPLQAAELYLAGSVLRGNGNGLGLNTEGFSKVVVSAVHSRFENNSGNGISVGRGGQVDLRDCVVAGNTTGVNVSNQTDAAFNAFNCSITGNTTGATASGPGNNSLNIGSSLISSNGIGVLVTVGGVARLSGNLITNNGTGISRVSTGIVFSSQNNAVHGNTTNAMGTLDPSPTM